MISVLTICLIEEILFQKHQSKAKFETVYEMLEPWENVTNMLEPL